MNTNDINTYLRSYKQFLGAFPLDYIKNIKIKPGSAIIINTHPSNMPGEHWVAVYIDINGSGEYFDSFGLPPLHLEIITFLEKYCYNNWRYNSITLQGLTAHTCGNYCVLFLAYRCKGLKFFNFISNFNNDSKHNDRIVADFFL